MTAATRFVGLAYKLSTATLLTGLASVAIADPIGYIQTSGQITVQPDGANSPVRINGNDYTFFANDRISATHGSAVLVLNGGGVVGLSKGTSATFQNSDTDGRLAVSLDQGSVTYSLPADAGNFSVDVDGVVFDTVASTGEVAGVLSVNENRQVDAFARAGEIRVLRANAAATAPAAPVSSAATSVTSVSDRSLAAQSFDTLANVPQGNTVQLQTSSETGMAAVSLMSASTSNVESATASTVETGQIGLVGSASGNTMVVVGGEGDEGIQSVSP